MTVKEMIEKLREYPDDLKVMWDDHYILKEVDLQEADYTAYNPMMCENTTNHYIEVISKQDY